MPKQLSNEWKEMLGSEYELVHEKYLHTLGNLTLLHSGDNSQLSNNNFQEKRKFFINRTNYTLNRYFTTSSIEKWDEDEIQKRTEILVKACLSIWKYLKSEINQTSDELLYLLDEDEEDFSHKKIKKYVFLEEEKSVKSWSDFYVNICRELYRENKALFETLIDSGELKGKLKDTKEGKNISREKEITEGVIIESNYSVIDFLRNIKRLLSKYKIEVNKLQFYLQEA